MSGADGASLIWAVGALVLVASALAARRLATGQWIKLAATWALIFGIVMIAYVAWQAAKP